MEKILKKVISLILIIVIVSSFGSTSILQTINALSYAKIYDYNASSIFENAYKSEGLTILPFILKNYEDSVKKSYILEQFEAAGKEITNEASLKDIMGTGDEIVTDKVTYTVLIYGDVDGNGIVDTFDAQDAFNHYLYNASEGYGLTGVYKIAANVLNTDDVVDTFDAQQIFNFGLGLDNQLLAKTPEFDEIVQEDGIIAELETKTRYYCNEEYKITVKAAQGEAIKKETVNYEILKAGQTTTDADIIKETELDNGAIELIFTASKAGIYNIKIKVGDKAANTIEITVVEKVDIKKPELEAIKEKLETSLIKEDYTVDSWNKLQEAIKTAEEAISQEEYDAVVSLLDESTLVPEEWDRTELNNVLEALKDLNQYDYTQETWNELQEAVKAATDAKVKSEYNKVKDQLTIDGLQKLDFEKPELKNIMEEAKDLVESDYEAASWNELQEAIKTATDATIESEYNKVKDILALDTLIKVKFDKNELYAVEKAIENLEPSNYTDASWAELQEAIKIASEATLKSQYDKVKDKLSIDTLVKIIAEINAEIEEPQTKYYRYGEYGIKVTFGAADDVTIKDGMLDWKIYRRVETSQTTITVNGEEVAVEEITNKDIAQVKETKNEQGIVEKISFTATECGKYIVKPIVKANTNQKEVEGEPFTIDIIENDEVNNVKLYIGEGNEPIILKPDEATEPKTITLYSNYYENIPIEFYHDYKIEGIEASRLDIAANKVELVIDESKVEKGLRNSEGVNVDGTTPVEQIYLKGKEKTQGTIPLTIKVNDTEIGKILIEVVNPILNANPLDGEDMSIYLGTELSPDNDKNGVIEDGSYIYTLIEISKLYENKISGEKVEKLTLEDVNKANTGDAKLNIQIKDVETGEELKDAIWLKGFDAQKNPAQGTGSDASVNIEYLGIALDTEFLSERAQEILAGIIEHGATITISYEGTEEAVTIENVKVIKPITEVRAEMEVAQNKYYRYVEYGIRVKFGVNENRTITQDMLDWKVYKKVAGSQTTIIVDGEETAVEEVTDKNIAKIEQVVNEQGIVEKINFVATECGKYAIEPTVRQNMNQKEIKGEAFGVDIIENQTVNKIKLNMGKGKEPIILDPSESTTPKTVTLYKDSYDTIPMEFYHKYSLEGLDDVKLDVGANRIEVVIDEADATIIEKELRTADGLKAEGETYAEQIYLKGKEDTQKPITLTIKVDNEEIGKILLEVVEPSLKATPLDGEDVSIYLGTELSPDNKKDGVKADNGYIYTLLETGKLYENRVFGDKIGKLTLEDVNNANTEGAKLNIQIKDAETGADLTTAIWPKGFNAQKEPAQGTGSDASVEIEYLGIALDTEFLGERENEILAGIIEHGATITISYEGTTEAVTIENIKVINPITEVNAEMEIAQNKYYRYEEYGIRVRFGANQSRPITQDMLDWKLYRKATGSQTTIVVNGETIAVEEITDKTIAKIEQIVNEQGIVEKTNFTATESGEYIIKVALNQTEDQIAVEGNAFKIEVTESQVVNKVKLNMGVGKEPITLEPGDTTTPKTITLYKDSYDSIPIEFYHDYKLEGLNDAKVNTGANKVEIVLDEASAAKIDKELRTAEGIEAEGETAVEQIYLKGKEKTEGAIELTIMVEDVEIGKILVEVVDPSLKATPVDADDIAIYLGTELSPDNKKDGVKADGDYIYTLVEIGKLYENRVLENKIGKLTLQDVNNANTEGSKLNIQIKDAETGADLTGAIWPKGYDAQKEPAQGTGSDASVEIEYLGIALDTDFLSEKEEEILAGIIEHGATIVISYEGTAEAVTIENVKVVKPITEVKAEVEKPQSKYYRYEEYGINVRFGLNEARPITENMLDWKVYRKAAGSKTTIMVDGEQIEVEEITDKTIAKIEQVISQEGIVEKTSFTATETGEYVIKVTLNQTADQIGIEGNAFKLDVIESQVANKIKLNMGEGKEPVILETGKTTTPKTITLYNGSYENIPVEFYHNYEMEGLDDVVLEVGANRVELVIAEANGTEIEKSLTDSSGTPVNGTTPVKQIHLGGKTTTTEAIEVTIKVDDIEVGKFLVEVVEPSLKAIPVDSENVKMILGSILSPEDKTEGIVDDDSGYIYTLVEIGKLYENKIFGDKIGKLTLQDVNTANEQGSKLNVQIQDAQTGAAITGATVVLKGFDTEKNPAQGSGSDASVEIEYLGISIEADFVTDEEAEIIQGIQEHGAKIVISYEGTIDVVTIENVTVK
ncbi:MAG: hypothetical protein HFJ55_07890 [Clostridia bacterium]|nr:hypothetical protein [Clostridia bacterium]